jgi:hypothetical protein
MYISILDRNRNDPDLCSNNWTSCARVIFVTRDIEALFAARILPCNFFFTHADARDLDKGMRFPAHCVLNCDYEVCCQSWAAIETSVNSSKCPAMQTVTVIIAVALK